MTTVAFDGGTMAADTLATDAWGMREEVLDKILRGPDFLAAIGCAPFAPAVAVVLLLYGATL